MIHLRPLESGDLDRLADWLACDATRQWLDPSVADLDATSGRQLLNPRAHRVWVMSRECGDAPFGAVALSNVSIRHDTALFWAVIGEPELRGRGYAVQAAYPFLRAAFDDGVQSISTWVVDANQRALWLPWRLGFTYLGCQRSCHGMNGNHYDRHWWDLVPEELQRRSGNPPQESADFTLRLSKMAATVSGNGYVASRSTPVSPDLTVVEDLL